MGILDFCKQNNTHNTTTQSGTKLTLVTHEPGTSVLDKLFLPGGSIMVIT